MPENIKELPFPLLGIDVSNALSSQRSGTTPSGTNVRGYEPSEDRQRGGARPGLTALFEQIPEGSHLIQMLNTVDPTQEAGLLDDSFAWPRAPLPVDGPFPIQGDNPLDTPPPDGFDLDRSTIGPPASWGTVTTGGGVNSRNPGRIVREGGSGVWPNKNTLRVRRVPTIVWANPADIPFPVPLSGAQLNAVAIDPVTLLVVAGSFVYRPVSGTILLLGDGQPLYTFFTPTNSTMYTKNTKTVHINVTVSGPGKRIPVLHANEGPPLHSGDEISPYCNWTATDPVTAEDVPGVFTYDPPPTTMIVDGVNNPLVLTAWFVPGDNIHYENAMGSENLSIAPD